MIISLSKSLTGTSLAAIGFMFCHASFALAQATDESNFIIRSPAPIRGQYVTGGYFEGYEDPYGVEQIELPPAIVYRGRGGPTNPAEPYFYGPPMFYEW